VSTSHPTVLVAEDEAPLRETYKEALQPSYDVRTAGTCQAAVDSLSADPEVVCLDRDLTETDGDDVLYQLQAQNDHYYVTLLTGTEPSFDVTDLGIDDYLHKPVDQAALRSAVERLLSLSEYDETYRELSQKRVRRNVLLQEHSRSELTENEEFNRLQVSIKQLEAELREIASECAEVERDLRA